MYIFYSLSLYSSIESNLYCFKTVFVIPKCIDFHFDVPEDLMHSLRVLMSNAIQTNIILNNNTIYILASFLLIKTCLI